MTTMADGLIGELLVRQPRNHAVDRFKIRTGLGAEGPMRVLGIVQRAQVQRHEIQACNVRRISSA